MSTGRQIVETLTSQFEPTSMSSFEGDSIILIRSHFSAMTGTLSPGKHIKIAICMSAGGTVRYGNRSWSWKKGSVLVTAPEETATFTSPDVDMIGVAIDTAEFCHYCRPKQAQYISGVIEDPVIVSIITAMWHCAEFHKDNSAFIHESVAIVLKRLNTLDQSKEQTVSSGLSARQVAHVTQYIDMRIDQDIKVDSLANQIGMSGKQFSRALEASTGTKPYEFIIKSRMDKAKRHLLDGYCVTQVAGMVGYANPSKFSAAFLRVIGCSPSHWRSRNNVHKKRTIRVESL